MSSCLDASVFVRAFLFMYLRLCHFRRFPKLVFGAPTAPVQPAKGKKGKPPPPHCTAALLLCTHVNFVYLTNCQSTGLFFTPLLSFFTYKCTSNMNKNACFLLADADIRKQRKTAENNPVRMLHNDAFINRNARFAIH